MLMIFIVVLISLGILGASVFAGTLENRKAANRNSPNAQRNMKRMNLAKAAGVIPNRKENN
jgi:hypothetical protein